MNMIFIRSIALAVTFLFSLSFANAQYFDLTTGSSSIGSADPSWDVQLPGASTFISATTVTAHTGYSTNSCGKWISHGIINQPGGSLHQYPASGSAGDYTYKHEFNVVLPTCGFTANLDLSFMAADNLLTQIKVNGTSVTVPSGVDFNPGASISANVTSAMVSGNNVVEVTVYNQGSFQALQLCGGITVTGSGGGGSSATFNTSVINVSTDGTNNWEVKTGSGAYGPTILATIQAPYHVEPTGCSQWIKDPITNQFSGGGYFDFKLTFNVDVPPGCVIESATLDIPWIAADNELRRIFINNSVGNNFVAWPSGVSHNSPGSVNEVITSYLQPGSNDLWIRVDNYDKWVGLNLCGDITIVTKCEPCPVTPPSNLVCYAGGMLDWDEVPGALGYEVDIFYNDPECCRAGGEWFGQFFEIGDPCTSQLFVEPLADCYSWRVRSVCDGGSGPWSAKQCSCGSFGGGREKGTNGSQTEVANGLISAFPNPGTGIYTLQVSDSENFQYWVTGLKGEVVIANTNVMSQQAMVDLTTVQSGIYFLHVRSNDRVEMIKLIKQD